MPASSILSTRRERQEACDVAILGAGPSGAAAAISLGRMGFSVALLERDRFETIRVGETLPGEIIRPLTRLGVWTSFLAASHNPSPGTISIWGDMQPHERDFLFSPYGNSWHLDRTRFDAMLVQAANAGGSSVYRCARLEIAPRVLGQPWSIRTEVDGQALSLRAVWLIDSTGRSAWLSRRFGVRKRVYDRLIALIAFTSDSAILETRTLIEACSAGWWYFAPLPNGRTISALFTDSDLLSGDMREVEKFWANHLADTQLISNRLSTIPARPCLRVVTATSSKLDRAAGDGWLAVGDAAQSYDPLSGQGVLHAICSGMAAAQAIADLRAGDAHALAAFAGTADLEFKRYQTNQSSHYSREKRWPNSTFWNRRRSR
jgi:flavin-dependent dehydrogenase